MSNISSNSLDRFIQIEAELATTTSATPSIDNIEIYNRGSIGYVDPTRKPQQLHIFLSKPDGTIIAKVRDAHNVNHKIKLGALNELTFDLPYQVIINSELKRTRYIDMVRERYLLKIQLGNYQEWYIINKITEKADDSGSIKNVSAFSLGYELKDKLLRSYEVTSVTATQALTDALAGSIWNVGYVDADFVAGNPESKYRSFQVSSKSVLDFAFEVAETFNAVIEWDTVNRTVGLKKPENIGINKGLKLSYGHYLKTLDRTLSADEMVTRLKPYGKDGLTINEVNPTGSNYIEDFSFFMYPFVRDGSMNVLSSSYYMTDGLCNALLDYKNKIQTESGTFKSLLDEKTIRDTELDTLNNEKFNLSTQLAKIQDIVDVQQAQGYITIDNFIYNSPITKKVLIKDTLKFAVFVKIDNTSNLSVSVDGVTQTLTNGVWKMCGKKQSIQFTNIVYAGAATNVRVQHMVVNILDVEFSTASNDAALIEKYVPDNKQVQIDSKQSEINNKTSQITTIMNDIAALTGRLALTSNFTNDEITEMNMFVIEKEWSDNNYFEAQSLYDEALIKFEEIRSPQTVLNIDIVNFLEIVKEQRNWDKIVLGDTVTIEYEQFNIDVEAKIIQADFNYEDSSIKLTIANVKDIQTDDEKIIKLLYGSVSTSATVDMSKFKWDKVDKNESDIRSVLENVWNTADRGITAGVNESVIIDRRGITITDPTDPRKFLRATHGVLGITNDGGNTYKQAITSEGVIAERLYGQVIVGQNLTIGDSTGTFNIVGNLLTVKDNSNNTRVQLGEYETGKYGLKIVSKTNAQTILDENGILQTWQVQDADNMDATHPVMLKIYLPPDTASVRKAILNFTLEKFRTYSTGSSSGGGGTVTSDSFPTTGITSASAGASTPTSSSGGSSNTTSSSGGSSGPTSGGGTWFSSSGYTSGFSATSTDGLHNHGVSDGTWLAVTNGSTTVTGAVGFSGSGNHTHAIVVDHSHRVDVPAHTHAVTVPAHTHTVDILPHTHNVTLPSHSHDVLISNHTHALLYGIYESTTAIGVKVKINGIDRTTDLGGGTGYNTDITNLNVTSYLTIGQWNTIELSSTRLGRVNAVMFIQAFMNVQ